VFLLYISTVIFACHLSYVTRLCDARLQVCFGDKRTRFLVRALAEVVSPAALRCKTPPNSHPGR
jgi:hypothetical protein